MYVSMSIGSMISHVVVAGVLGLLIGGAIVYAVTKMTKVPAVR